MGFGGVTLLFALMIAHACASADSDSSGSFGPPEVGDSKDGGVDRYVADTALPDASEPSGGGTTDELCGGDTTPCDPEDVAACSGDGGSSGLSACQVTLADGDATTGCTPAGVGVDGDPCVSPSDCAPGLTCTGESGASQCRPYCCSGAEGCPEESFCAERPMRDVSALVVPRVPVCVPATPCSLDEPFPCDSEYGVCSCAAGTACMVVRDGLASCATPGTGMAEDYCPCAPGFVCSQTLGRCLELCHLSGVIVGECGDGECQSASSIPDGFGVCVGSSS